MSLRQWEVYALIDPRTNQVRYVGITFRKKARYNEHLSRATRGGRTHRDNWIRSLIALGLKPIYSILEQGSGNGWQDRERFWIAQHKLSCDLVNHTDGGDGTPGCIPSPELRQKWSMMRAGVKYAPGRVPAMLGKHHDVEAIEKIRQASIGRKMPESMKSKVSKARKGKPLNTEHRAKLSAAHRGKTLSTEHKQKIARSSTNRKPVLCIETGQTYKSITQVAHLLGVNEASVYQSIRKGCRCGGYHFRLA